MIPSEFCLSTPSGVTVRWSRVAPRVLAWQGLFFFLLFLTGAFEQKGLIPTSCRLAQLLFIVHLGALEEKKKTFKRRL